MLDEPRRLRLPVTIRSALAGCALLGACSRSPALPPRDAAELLNRHVRAIEVVAPPAADPSLAALSGAWEQQLRRKIRPCADPADLATCFLVVRVTLDADLERREPTTNAVIHARYDLGDGRTGARLAHWSVVSSDSRSSTVRVYGSDPVRDALLGATERNITSFLHANPTGQFPAE